MQEHKMSFILKSTDDDSALNVEMIQTLKKALCIRCRPLRTIGSS